MDGSILPIAFGAFTVLYIAGWFCIGRFLAVRARFGEGPLAGHLSQFDSRERASDR